jgi:hypothetical protein
MPRLIAVWLCVFAISGCDQQAAAPVATSAMSCCQCPGVWNDPPTDPQTYRIAPDCQNSSPGVTECEALCKALGYPTGRLAAGTCSPAPAGTGNLCK